MNKIKKRLMTLGLTAAIAACLGAWTAAPALAAESAATEDGQSASYAYTIRVFSGNQGTYDGESVITKNAGETVTIDAIRDTTVPADSKYYVKGIRQAGLDNNVAVDIVRECRR